MKKGKTITRTYYADLLMQPQHQIKKSRRGKLTRGVLFHQDNAPAHKSMAAMTAIHNCEFQLLEPYSPNLAPSDNYLFLKPKKELSGGHFATDDVVDAMNQFLRGQDADFYQVIQVYTTTRGLRWKIIQSNCLQINQCTLGHILHNHPSYSSTHTTRWDEVRVQQIPPRLGTRPNYYFIHQAAVILGPHLVEMRQDLDL